MKFKPGPLPGKANFPKVIQISLSKELVEAFKREAFLRKMSVSEYVRHLYQNSLATSSGERLNYLRTNHPDFEVVRSGRQLA